MNDNNHPQKNSFLLPGRNCWRKEIAERAAFLIDPAAYFAAFRTAARQAKRSIYILAWDIDSRTELLRTDHDDDLPITIGEFLRALVEEKPELHVHILLWDYALIFGLDREWFPEFKIGTEAHSRLHFQKDNYYPVGSSHHQKIVVIDDQIAFVGGIDLTKNRWDRQTHKPDDSKRVNPEGESYRPYHDVQVLVSGNAAAALGDLARERWHKTTSSTLAPPKIDQELSWPKKLPCQLKNVPVGIARTQPVYENQEEIKEIEQLYLDAIAVAEQSIYIENQYFTTPKIVEALSCRLEQSSGPEVVIVLPLKTDGWLSQLSMDILRANAVRELTSADRFSRLLICYPYRDDLTEDDSIKIHSKLMIVDDKLAHVGSANLNNRSMGLDTECDLSLVSEGDTAVEIEIASLREELVAEHLGCTKNQFQQIIAKHGSLIRSIQNYPNASRRLKKLQVSISKSEEVWLESQDLLDPEHPVKPDHLIKDMLPFPDEDAGSKKIYYFVGLLVILVGIGISWKYLPVEEYINGPAFSNFLDWIRQSPYSPLALYGIYIIGGLIIAPITLLISLTILTFGPLYGTAYALSGSLLNAIVTYAVGAIVQKKTLRHLTGRYVDKVNRLLSQKGILSTAIIRLIPLAPFSVINMLAGASHLKLRDFLLGTLIGMFPGILAIAGLFDRGLALFRDPNITTFAVFASLLLLIILVFIILKHWLAKYELTWDEGAND